jgi:hypothetical protein
MACSGTALPLPFTVIFSYCSIGFHGQSFMARKKSERVSSPTRIPVSLSLLLLRCLSEVPYQFLSLLNQLLGETSATGMKGGET